MDPEKPQVPPSAGLLLFYLLSCKTTIGHKLSSLLSPAIQKQSISGNVVNCRPLVMR